MNKKAVGIIITIVAIGAVIGIVLVNHNDKKDDMPMPASTSNTQTNTNTSTPTTNTPTAQAGTDKVTISNFSFSAAKITVKKGTTVTWTNQDSTAHTVTADSGAGPKSSSLQKGDTYSYTFNDTGSFSYHCEFHPSMLGTVVVTE